MFILTVVSKFCIDKTIWIFNLKTLESISSSKTKFLTMLSWEYLITPRIVKFKCQKKTSWKIKDLKENLIIDFIISEAIDSVFSNILLNCSIELSVKKFIRF